MSELASSPQSKSGTIKIIYILFLVSYVTGGLASVIGVIWAYVLKSDTDGYEKEHLNKLTKLFWINLISLIVIAISWFFVIGMFLFVIWLIWSIYTTIKGLTRLSDLKAP